MPDLNFQITGVEAAARGITPLLQFTLVLTNQPAAERIHAALLQVQIQIQAPQRPYHPRERERLGELFGAPERWAQTLRNRLWTSVTTSVHAFSERIEATLTVPCTYDLTFAAAKYFHGLEEGEVPLLFLFSGTAFYASASGPIQVTQVPRDKECEYRMPVSAWKSLMEHHYPNSAWLYLRRDLFDRLCAYRRSQGLATWEQTIEQLLASTETLATTV